MDIFANCYKKLQSVANLACSCVTLYKGAGVNKVQQPLSRPYSRLQAVKLLVEKLHASILLIFKPSNISANMKFVYDLLEYLTGFQFFTCCSDPVEQSNKQAPTPETSASDEADYCSTDELFHSETTRKIDEDEILDEQQDQEGTNSEDKYSDDLLDDQEFLQDDEAIPSVKIEGKRVAKTTNIPARRARRMGSHLRKINYTGAAAAPPPYKIEEVVGPLSDKMPAKTELAGGIYLTYHLSDNGCLKRIYATSEPKMDSDSVIIAYSVPKKTIPSFKYEKGDETLINNLGKVLTSDFVNDRKPFYSVWIEYIRVAHSFLSVTYLLPEFNVSPPPRVQLVCIKKGDKTISEPPVDAPIYLENYDVIAALPPGIGAIKIGTTTRAQLVSLTTKFGAIIEL